MTDNVDAKSAGISDQTNGDLHTETEEGGQSEKVVGKTEKEHGRTQQEKRPFEQGKRSGSGLVRKQEGESERNVESDPAHPENGLTLQLADSITRIQSPVPLPKAP